MAAQQREKEETELKVPESIPLCSQTLPVPAPPPQPHTAVTRSSEISDLKLSSTGSSSERIDLKLFSTDESRSSSGTSTERMDLKIYGTDESRSSSGSFPERIDLKLSGSDDSRSSSCSSLEISDLKRSITVESRSSSGSSIDLFSATNKSRSSSRSSIYLKLSGIDESRSTSAQSPENTDLVSRKRQREVNRCSGIGCRRKVGLMPFRCRCGEVFCSEHRYSDRHDCSYDYKAAGREAIARENPVVKAAKIVKV